MNVVVHQTDIFDTCSPFILGHVFAVKLYLAPLNQRRFGPTNVCFVALTITFHWHLPELSPESRPGETAAAVAPLSWSTVTHSGLPAG